MKKIFSVIYTNENQIASFGEYSTKQDAMDSIIKFIENNDGYDITKFHISEKMVDSYYNGIDANKLYNEINVYYLNEGMNYIGTVYNIKDANALIIDDIKKIHKDAIVSDYLIYKK